MGAIYLENIINELNLKHIKIPKKFVIVDDTVDQIGIKVHPPINKGCMLIDSEHLTVEAEYIHQADRILSREEVTELITLIKKAEFNDLLRSNFIIADEGIYLIDTEMKGFFETIRWHNFGWLKEIVEEGDKEYIDKLLTEPQKAIVRRKYIDFDIATQFLADVKNESLTYNTEQTAELNECVAGQKLAGLRNFSLDTSLLDKDTFLWLPKSKTFWIPVKEILASQS